MFRPDYLAGGVDHGNERGHVAVEERSVLGAADEVIADLRSCISASLLGRFGQRIDRGSLDGRRSQPPLRSKTVKLKPARCAVRGVLRHGGELVLVAGRGAQGRPDRQERQQTDDDDDQSVDRDDLDSHEPSDPPRLRRPPAQSVGVCHAYVTDAQKRYHSATERGNMSLGLRS